MNAPQDTSRRYSQKISTVLRLCQIKVIREQFESHLAKQALKCEIDQLRETYNESVEQLHMAEKLVEEFSAEKIGLMAERRILSKRCLEVGTALKDARRQADWFTAQRKSIQEKLREVAADATRERIRNERTKEQLQEEQRKQLELENFLKAGPHSFRGLVPDAVFGDSQIGAERDGDAEQKTQGTWTKVLYFIRARQNSLDVNVELYERLRTLLCECRCIKLQVEELEFERNKRQNVLIKKKVFLEVATSAIHPPSTELLSVGSDGCLDPDRCSSVSNTGSMEEQRIFLEFCQPSPAHGSRQSVRLLEEPARSGRSLQSSPTHRSPMQDRRRSLALPTKPKEDRRRSLVTPRSRRRSTLAAASRRSSAMPGSRSPTSRRRSSALTGSRSPSGRRRSSAMPGSRSPSGRRLRRDEEGVLDSWADYHQQVSPPAEESERQRLYSTGGYRCRSFSTSGNSAIFCYQGRVVMPGDESRPTCCLRRVPTHRVRVIGADGVGKSCLIHQLVESEDLCSYQNIVTTPDSSSDTLPELPKTRLILDDEESELVFEETHKTEVTAQDLIETDAFLIVYSMADGESYEFAESILGRLLLLCTILRNQRKSSCGSTTRRCEQDLFRKAIIVVANKDDLNRCKVITIKDGRTLAEHHKSKYATISAFIGHKTNHLLVGTLRQIRLIENVGTRQTKKRPSNLPIIQLPEGDILDPNDQSISSCNWMCGNLYDLTRDFLYSMWNKCFLKSPRQCENLNVL